MTDRDTQIVRAALQRAAMATHSGPSEPPKPYDEWGDMTADTAERHAERVLDYQLWQAAQDIRALADDPAEVAAILATVPEVEPGRVDWLRDPDAFVDDDGREGSRGDDTW